MIWKRLLDIIFATLLLFPLSALIIIISIRAILKRDRPVFYISERMVNPSTPFSLIKFRTMSQPTKDDENDGVSGGAKTHRITRFGHFLRHYRIDEVPQIINIIAGSMSFVGPRPPLRVYTERFPVLYEQVLQNRPGITGLATIIFHQHEAQLLNGAMTKKEIEEIYVRRCIPRKARLDLIYQRNISFKLDLYILYLTAAKFFPLPGARAKRVRKG